MNGLRAAVERDGRGHLAELASVGLWFPSNLSQSATCWDVALKGDFRGEALIVGGLPSQGGKVFRVGAWWLQPLCCHRVCPDRVHILLEAPRLHPTAKLHLLFLRMVEYILISESGCLVVYLSL